MIKAKRDETMDSLDSKAFLNRTFTALVNGVKAGRLLKDFHRTGLALRVPARGASSPSGGVRTDLQVRSQRKQL